MTKKSDIETILNEIRSVFPQDPIPIKSNIISHECEECFALRDAFSEYKWHEVPRKTIEIHYQDIPLFTKEAFRYYIPTFLSYSLTRKEPTNEEWVSDLPPVLFSSKYQPVLDFTIYSLREKAKGNLNTSQIEIIKKWLEFVISNSSMFETDTKEASLVLTSLK